MSGPGAATISRRNISTKGEKSSGVAEELGHDHEHTHSAATSSHSHSHSHSIFGGHSHSHDDVDEQTAEKVMDALKGQGDRGSRITVIGLFSNVALTAGKGAAGWYMNSASLLADAGHSLSDLIGDFVTLFCWKLSRRPPSERYPYGFAKFETLGTATVSLLLVGGALGIGFHSYHLLIETLAQTASTLPAGPLQAALQNVTEIAQLPTVVSGGHAHGHGHGHGLDPNAAWFAAGSVVVKEWLFRVTKKVADEENSPVLLANAYHHRSDAYSSLVAVVAILGTWYFPALPLDPIGGFLVSLLIIQQSFGILTGAFRDLTDAGISARKHQTLVSALQPLVSSSSAPSPLLSVTDLRARRAGSRTFVDLTAAVPRTLDVNGAASLEAKIERTLKEARREVAEVRVKFRPVDDEDRL